MIKKAFTLLELVFVVIVIGILASIIIPTSRTNSLREAAIQLVSHIRYTQHLAMIDDKYNANRKDDAGSVIWYKDRWQLVFYKGANSDQGKAYTIFADTSGTGVSRGDANAGEIAINPQNPQQLMTGGYSGSTSLDIKHANFKGMPILNLGKSYGITSVTLSGGCSGGRIAFDYLGRPIKGDHNTMSQPYSSNRLIQTNCNITLTKGQNNIVIAVRPETGYSSITTW